MSKLSIFYSTYRTSPTNQGPALLYIPMLPAHDDRSSLVPRTIDLVLVFLQADTPPAAPAHSKGADGAADHHTQQAAAPGPDSRRILAGAPRRGPGDDDADAGAGAEHQQGGEGGVVTPAAVAGVAAEDGEQAEDLDAEEGEAEDLAGRGQAAGQHRRRHQGGVGRQRRHGDAAGGGGGAAARRPRPRRRVVEEEDVEGPQAK